MTKILTVGQTSSGILRIEDQLMCLRDELNFLMFTRAHGGSVAKALKENPEVLIYDALEVRPMMGLLIEEIRKTGYEGYIIVVARIPMGVSLNDYKHLKDVHFVDKPYLGMQLQGLVRKCLHEGAVKKRLHDRYDVHVPAILEFYNTNIKIKTVVSNISKTGACIQGQFKDLKEGALVKLLMVYDNYKKERMVNTRVIWVKGNDQGKETAGLKFVSSQDVYEYLLGQVLI